jgi:hypothetical protein
MHYAFILLDHHRIIAPELFYRLSCHLQRKCDLHAHTVHHDTTLMLIYLTIIVSSAFGHRCTKPSLFGNGFPIT